MLHDAWIGRVRLGALRAISSALVLALALTYPGPGRRTVLLFRRMPLPDATPCRSSNEFTGVPPSSTAAMRMGPPPRPENWQTWHHDTAERTEEEKEIEEYLGTCYT